MSWWTSGGMPSANMACIRWWVAIPMWSHPCNWKMALTRIFALHPEGRYETLDTRCLHLDTQTGKDIAQQVQPVAVTKHWEHQTSLDELVLPNDISQVPLIHASSGFVGSDVVTVLRDMVDLLAKKTVGSCA
eukprot:5632523-Amphidinium_carterae.1